MKREDALREAEEMIEYLRIACLGFRPGSDPDGGDAGSICFAGSLRRGVEKDYREIDLIMIPDLTILPPPRVQFGDPMPSKREIHATKLDRLLWDLHEAERIHITQDGPRNKKFLMLDSELSFDLYIVRPPATWGVQLLIRTGPEDFGHYCVTRRSGSAHSSIHGRVRGGALPDGYRVQAGAVWEGEEKVKESELLQKTPIGFDTEESFLDFLGLGWIEPEDRVAYWGGRRPK